MSKIGTQWGVVRVTLGKHIGELGIEGIGGIYMEINCVKGFPKDTMVMEDVTMDTCI